MSVPPPPERPYFPKPSEGASLERRASCLPLLMAMTLALFLIAGLMLISVGTGFVAVVAGMVGFIGLQYLVCGWWLPRILRPEDSNDEPHK